MRKKQFNFRRRNTKSSNSKLNSNIEYIINKFKNINPFFSNEDSMNIAKKIQRNLGHELVGGKYYGMDVVYNKVCADVGIVVYQNFLKDKIDYTIVDERKNNNNHIEYSHLLTEKYRRNN